MISCRAGHLFQFNLLLNSCVYVDNWRVTAWRIYFMPLKYGTGYCPDCTDYLIDTMRFKIGSRIPWFAIRNHTVVNSKSLQSTRFHALFDELIFHSLKPISNIRYLLQCAYICDNSRILLRLLIILCHRLFLKNLMINSVLFYVIRPFFMTHNLLSIDSMQSCTNCISSTYDRKFFLFYLC